jgi:hypothetical protein
MAFIKTYKRYFKTAALIWAACLVLFSLVYILVLRSQKDNRERLENRIAEKKQLHESALRASQTETKIHLNEEIGRLRDRLSDFVIDFDNSADLTFDISKIANDKNVASLSIKGNEKMISELPNCEYIGEGHIDIGFNAGFNQFATFLNALERHRPVLFVDQFTITNSRRDDLGYQVNLKVSVFVKKTEVGKDGVSGSG